jgi:Flp pilus assembly pilin Flp
LLAEDGGATAVEYALMIAAFSGIILFVLFLVGNVLNNARENVAGPNPMESGESPDAGTFIHTRPAEPQ